MTRPLISVVMPVYNCRRYVGRAMQSILRQTLGDFEFIIVDDDSTDGSSKILDRYAATDQRIRVIRQKNSGITRALNVGANASRGKFIARMDGDDISLPRRFEIQAAYLAAHADVVAVGCQMLLVDPEGWPIRAHQFPTSHAAICSRLMTGEGALPHPGSMIRRSAFVAVGGYREEFDCAQDLDLWVRLGEVGLLANDQRLLLHYRLSASSISIAKRRRQMECARKAVSDALKRRGLSAPVDNSPLPIAPVGEQDLIEDWCRSALEAENFHTAIKLAITGVRKSPGRRASWKMLARALSDPIFPVRTLVNYLRSSPALWR